jgi:diguanylate cyclase (GGDEF)-like protein
MGGGESHHHRGTVSGGPAKRLGVVILLVALCFCAVCAKVLYDGRRVAWDRATDIAAGFVATIESEIARNIESYDLSLQGVIENLAYPEIISVSPDLRQLLLFDRSATAKHLHAITLLDQNGIARLDSRLPFPKPVDRSKREHFQFHQDNPGAGLHVSKPFVTASGFLVTALSRRLSNPDGTFAGVVVGTIRLSYFEELFARARLGPNDNITLSRTDGTLMMRWPYRQEQIGMNVKHADLFKHLVDAPKGSFETRSVTDGVHRLFVYSKVGNLPLVIALGQSVADIYAPWWHYAGIIGLVMVMLCAVALLFAVYLAREMARRNRAETALERLASTDGLTGLLNRRAFNSAIEREWRRAAREGTSLALLMIDTDHFKRYNDLYGHQAGDALLAATGAAMLVCIRRGTDVAARYGGDEFAMLLPDTNEFGALQVAKYLRERFADACEEREIAQSGLSIGVAALAPRSGQPLTALIEAADEALYRAKGMGRNRTEAAAVEPAVQAAVAA